MLLQCRSCLVSAQTMQYISLNEILANDTTYLEWFNECTRLHASSTDCLPDTVCDGCAQRLHAVYDFVRTARQSDAQLRVPPGSIEICKGMEQLEFEEMKQLAVERVMEEFVEHDDNNMEEEEDVIEEHILEDGNEMIEKESLDEKSVIENQSEPPKFELTKASNYLNEECDEQYFIQYETEKLENNFNHSRWKCKDCRLVLRGDVSYEGHMNCHKGVWPYKCSDCECAFRSKGTLIQHVSMRHNFKVSSKLFICHICEKNFRLHQLLAQHIQHEHQQTLEEDGERSEGMKVQTEQSKLMLRMTTNLDHISYMSENRINVSWKCEVCNRQLRSANSLRNHIRTVHVQDAQPTEADDVQCELCMRQLLRRNYDKHMALHARKSHKVAEDHTKFICAYCLRECKNKKTLCQHEKIHQGESPMVVYVCSDCDRQYNTQYLLQQHRKQVHKERDNVCPICGNSFKLRNQLMNHIKLHLEKNIVCSQCDKRYSRKVDLKVHMRTHTGELPFACHLCEKRFAIKVRLTYHLQKHYGVKHVCKDCSAEFNSRLKLKAHLFKHTGMPYRCEACDHDGFPNRYIFKRHLLRVHNTTMSDEELVRMFQHNTGKTIRIRRISNSEHMTVERAIDTNVVVITKVDDEI